MKHRTVAQWLIKRAKAYIDGSLGFVAVAPYWFENKPTFYVRCKEYVCAGPPIVFFWDGMGFCKIPFPKCFDYLREDDDEDNLSMDM